MICSSFGFIAFRPCGGHQNNYLRGKCMRGISCYRVMSRELDAGDDHAVGIWCDIEGLAQDAAVQPA
ncbi:hypothetical protein SPHINGOR109_50984 [Sphingorhabdus sp. 109]|nr:hypothetical protein SPHINGOR109_50984 [Sphingorhabdus sp. 109]